LNVLVAGYYGFGNLGDELILSTMIGQLEKKYDKIQICVLSASPQKTKLDHKVQTLSRWRIFSIIRQIWQSDLFILGGGGLLQDKTSLRSLIYYLGLICLARLCQTPVRLYALGVESLQRKIGKKLSRWVLSFSDMNITVRDTYSKSILESIGVNGAKVHVTGDPVFCRDIPKRPQPRYQVKKESVLMIPRFPCPPSAWDMYRAMAKYFRDDKGMSVKWLLFHPKVEEPILFSGNESPLFTPHDYIFKDSIDETASRISEHDYVVSARFHGLVLAAMGQRPFLGMGDREKVGHFCQLWGMPYLAWDSNTNQIEAALVQLFHTLPNPKEHDLDHWRQDAIRTLDFV